jgi:hypothetical protein
LKWIPVGKQVTKQGEIENGKNVLFFKALCYAG